MAPLLGIPHVIWAKLAKPASSVNVDHKAGDTASLAPGGSIEILGFDVEFGDLCRYRVPRGEVAAGAMCPDNAIIFLPHDTTGRLPTLEKVQADFSDREIRRRNVVSRILGE